METRPFRPSVNASSAARGDREPRLRRRRAVERIYGTFAVAPDSTPGAVVDPDPALVGTGTTVCYDLPFWGSSGPAFDYLLLRLTDETHLRALYVPGAYATGQCSALEGSFPEVDDGWAQFIR